MAAAAAAGGSGDGGSRGGGWPVKKPHEQGMLNAKVKKRKAPVPRDRAQSGSPDSAVTTCPAMTPAALNGGGGVGGHDVDQEVQQPANGKRLRTAAASSGDRVTEVQQQTNGKRPRLVWTTELHDIFVRACSSLEREVVPKKILEAMKVNGLTRENVASHLQKYRQNMQGKGQAARRRGNGGNGTVTMQPAAAPASLQPAFPQPQPPIAAAFPQAASPSLTVNPPPTPPQGPFAVPNNMPQPQMGRVQLVQALPALVQRHQRHPDVPILMQAPAVPHQLFYQPQQFHQAAMQQRHRIMMEQQARHAARMNLQQAAVAPGHGHQNMVARNYELGAQTLARSAPAAASQTVNMSGGLCLVPEPGTRDEQTEARVDVAQLQIAVEAEGGQVPAAEPAFAGSANPDGGQQEDSCGVLHFWNTGSAPSMDHEFPPNKPV